MEHVHEQIFHKVGKRRPSNPLLPQLQEHRRLLELVEDVPKVEVVDVKDKVALLQEVHPGSHPVALAGLDIAVYLSKLPPELPPLPVPLLQQVRAGIGLVSLVGRSLAVSPLQLPTGLRRPFLVLVPSHADPTVSGFRYGTWA